MLKESEDRYQCECKNKRDCFNHIRPIQDMIIEVKNKDICVDCRYCENIKHI